MCWLFNRKKKAKSKPFYCKTFRAAPYETPLDIAGRMYIKTLDDKAKDLETGEEKWINSDILCMIYLEEK